MTQAGTPIAHRRARRPAAIDERGRELLAVVEAIYADLELEWADIIGDVALRQTRARLERVVRERHGGTLPQLRRA